MYRCAWATAWWADRPEDFHLRAIEHARHTTNPLAREGTRDGRCVLSGVSINSAVSALRFFFTVTLDRPDRARQLTVVPYPRRIRTFDVGQILALPPLG